MSTLINVVFAAKAKSTHHKMALDALRHLEGPQAAWWRNTFLKYYQHYLDGAKAPDTKFKDFTNHVLHVGDDYWGGAVRATVKWYDRMVESLRRHDWKEAVYAAGVMSHYYTDPIQPFHTAQSEAETKIHRAAEWSIAKSYDELRAILEEDLGGYPDVDVPEGDGWLAEMVRAGADLAHPNYDLLIDHYDFDAGRRNPPAGFDQEAKDTLAVLVGHSVIGLARILERAFAESAVTPPQARVGLLGFLARLTIPIFWVTRKLADSSERQIVEAMYDEARRTGKVIANLPEDDRAVRGAHAEEVRKISLAELDAEEPRPTGAKHGEGTPKRPRRRGRRPLVSRRSAAIGAAAMVATTSDAGATTESLDAPDARTDEPHAHERPEHDPPVHDPPVHDPSVHDEPAHDEPAYDEPAHDVPETLRFYLERSAPIVDAPSIGPKTAARLEQLGVETVDDLLESDAQDIADGLGHSRIDSDVVRDWQTQAALVCRVPRLRGHDAQILVACDVADPDQLATMDAHHLLSIVEPVAASEEGQRILRSGAAPDLDEIADWIRWAGDARPLKAA